MTYSVKEIIDQLDEFAPKKSACEWDNPGLLVGQSSFPVSKVYLALDATTSVVEQAIEEGCDLIVTHHPILFRAIKSINDDCALGLKLMDLIRNDVAVFSMHTNFDSCPGGMGDLVCERLQLQKTGFLEPTGYEDDKELPYGIGFTAELPHRMTAPEFAAFVKERFQLPFVQYYDAGLSIKTIACCPGSGRSELHEVLNTHADAFLTGDMGHHEAQDLVEEGVNVIDAGHYGLEHIFIPFMKSWFHDHFPEITAVTAPIQFPAASV